MPLTLQQAADRLGVHYMTAYRYVRHGRLPARKEGKTWIVEEADLEAMQHAAPVRRGEAPWGDRLESRMLAGDVTGALGVVQDALASGVEPSDVYTSMLMPAMRGIGARWAAGDLDVSEEHRASAVAQRIIGQLGHRFARRGQSKGTVLLCSPPGEQHWLGAMMVSDLLRAGGYGVVDLGPDMPLDSLQIAVAAAPDLVAVGLGSAVSGRDQQVIATIKALREVTEVPIVVGGGGVEGGDHARRLGADAYCGPGDDPTAVISDMVG